MLRIRELPDNPKFWWNTDKVALTVKQTVQRWKIDALITFDDGGVSGHINHRAVAAGVEYPTSYNPRLMRSRHFVLKTGGVLPTYQLSTVFLLRKYTILLDLPIVLFLSIPRFLITSIQGDPIGKWGLMVASPSMYFTGRHAFQKHASQVVWDRYFL
jgi:N-acetylglucosaminylphosphatidylinositol deacetylase